MKNTLILFFLIILINCAATKKNINFNAANNQIKSDINPENILLAEIGAKKIAISDFEKNLKLNEQYFEQHLNFDDYEELEKTFKEYIMFNTISQLAINENLDKTDTFLRNVEEYKKQLLVEMFDQRIYEKIKKPSDMELYDYYLKNKILFATPRKIALKNILADFNNFADIKEVFEKLKTRAQKFDDIINDTYYQQKFKISDLGFIQSGIVDPELEKYVFDLKEGEWTNIIKTKLGFHIVYCYKVIEPQTPEFNDEIKAEIYNKIMEDAYKKNVEQAIENFRKNNKYQIYDDNLKYLIERLNKKN